MRDLNVAHLKSIKELTVLVYIYCAYRPWTLLITSELWEICTNFCHPFTTAHQSSWLYVRTASFDRILVDDPLRWKKKYFRSSQQTGYENGFNDERKRISLGQKCHRCHSHTKVYAARLTLIGMRGDIFISLSFLDQILLAAFLSKLFCRWKLASIGLIWRSLCLFLNALMWH